MPIPRALLRLTLAWLLLSALPALAAAPQLTPETRQYDFGRIQAGAQKDHVFRFRNSGDAPLIIEQVRADCGCTSTLLSQREIPPGGRGELRATFNSKGFRGPVVKTIYVQSNDSRQPETRLTLHATVIPEVAVHPETIVLRDLRPGQPAVTRVRLTNHSDRLLTLSDFRGVPRELTAEPSTRRLKPGASATVRVTARLPEGQNRLSGYLFIITSSQQTPTLRIPVQGLAANPGP